MIEFQQELMTVEEAAKWFRRSASWLRQQPDLLRLAAAGGQPLYHVRVCRSYILGRLCGLEGARLRQAQVRALAATCGLEHWPHLGEWEQSVMQAGPASTADKVRE